MVSASLAGLPGSEAFGQSLESTLAWAYERNPRLAAARANLRATDEQLPQAKSNFWRPSITLNAQEGRSHITQHDREVAAGVGSATDKTTMSHVAMHERDENGHVTWQEPVEDADYLAKR